MKNLNLLKSTLLLFALVVGSTSLWADYQQSVTYATKIAATPFEWTGSAGETWTGTVTEGAVNQNMNNGYAQVGTKSNPSTSIVVSTSGITDKIRSIVVNCAAYQGKASLSATVGGSAFGEQGQAVPSWSSSTGGNITFTGEASGAIVITMTNGTGGQAMYIKSITVSYGTEIPSGAQLVGDGITWDFSTGEITASATNSITATDGETVIKYVAGKSDQIKDGALQPGGASTKSDKKLTGRYFILNITKSGVLTLESTSKFGEYLIYQGESEDPSKAIAQTSIITPTSSVPESGNIDISNGNYVFIGFNSQIYTKTLNWNDASSISLTTTDNMDGWRSFYDATQDYEVDANTKIYVAAVSATAGTVELTQKDATKIRHGEAVILKTSAGDHKMVLTKTTDAATLGDNVLAYATSGTIDGYRLGYKDGTGVAFYKYNAAAPASGVVYIDKNDVNTSTGAHEFLAMSFGDVTGIESLTPNPSPKGEGSEYYNLAGQRVAQPTKGLYIVNGKKVAIK